MPRVSVVVPLYNQGDYVRAALDSVLAQTVDDLEVLVVDDASTDHGPSVVESLSDLRVRLLRHDRNLGPSRARNTGLKHAAGEAVAALDADDVWAPDKLAKQCTVLAHRSDVGAVFTAAHLMDAQGKPVREAPPQAQLLQGPGDRARWLREGLLGHASFCHSSALIRRDVHVAAGGYDPRFAQMYDVHLWPRVMARADAVLLDAPLVFYRLHDAASSAPGPAQAHRQVWEAVLAREPVFAIKDLGLMTAAFPELVADDPTPETLAPLLARFAARQPDPVVALAGLRTLTDWLAELGHEDLLRVRHGDDARILPQMAAQADPLGVVRPRLFQWRRLDGKTTPAAVLGEAFPQTLTLATPKPVAGAMALDLPPVPLVLRLGVAAAEDGRAVHVTMPEALRAADGAHVIVHGHGSLTVLPAPGEGRTSLSLTLTIEAAGPDAVWAWLGGSLEGLVRNPSP